MHMDNLTHFLLIYVYMYIYINAPANTDLMHPLFYTYIHLAHTDYMPPPPPTWYIYIRLIRRLNGGHLSRAASRRGGCSLFLNETAPVLVRYLRLRPSPRPPLAACAC